MNDGLRRAFINQRGRDLASDRIDHRSEARFMSTNDSRRDLQQIVRYSHTD